METITRAQLTEEARKYPMGTFEAVFIGMMITHGFAEARSKVQWVMEKVEKEYAHKVREA